MEAYKFKKLYNGDILLKKIVIDNINYTIIDKENGDKLLRKITNINITDIADIKNYNFTKSIITKCVIDNKEFNILKYKSILNQIYKKINDGTRIIKNTKLNIKTIRKEDKGFYYLYNIGISVQCVDSNKCLLEIITQCIENEIEIYMKIKLIDNITITIAPTITNI